MHAAALILGFLDPSAAVAQAFAHDPAAAHLSEVDHQDRIVAAWRAAGIDAKGHDDHDAVYIPRYHAFADIVTPGTAWEVDFAHNGKEYEAVGQGLFYGAAMGKRAGVILLSDGTDGAQVERSRLSAQRGRVDEFIVVPIAGAVPLPKEAKIKGKDVDFRKVSAGDLTPCPCGDPCVCGPLCVCAHCKRRAIDEPAAASPDGVAGGSAELPAADPEAAADGGPRTSGGDGGAVADSPPAVSWTVISATWCDPCHKTLDAAAGLGLPVRSIDHQSPEALALFGGRAVASLPTVVLLRDGRAVGWKSGGLTRAAWLRLAAEQGVAVPAAPAVRGPLVYRGSGAAWTWTGDIRDHLRLTHGIDGGGMSDSEAVRAHDAAHGTRRPVRQPLATGFVPAFGGSR